MDKVGPGLPQRVHDVVDEAHLGRAGLTITRHPIFKTFTYLRLLHSGIVPIAHGTDVEAGLPLLVALREVVEGLK